MRKEDSHMELILVNDSKIKIMLTASDMNRFEISPDILEKNDDQIRSAFRDILNEARDRTGFDTAGDRLYIQYYPSKEGGCELFVTKLGSSASGGGQLPVFHTPKAVGLAELIPETDTGGNRRICAYAFPSITVLLSVCRRLAGIPHAGESAAWKGDEGNVYLFLYGINPPRGGLSDPYSFLTEYGSAQNADSLLLYIQEHGKPICEHDAIETLASL